ncbi:class II glutamine amidotransferase [Acidocella aminolytica]|jgi:glutamate synthase domain-containing protein 1|uniref:Glutamine amidotransferase n=1 Tax=Acidocella aminolytica 101 = DSM 11237 TaxID=1120923 RepID=A0A0D6PDB8_9PROT|nr:glutamine amidotransferase family protein [Acidocella aminolytica]GAN79356.1 glutamine amidotransferase [Acidocella aminolytica 101 = DSM 11237]GBQ39434.1 glutamate synthase domain 1 [Acidocella aminolytica 101 = DSM 11237]SHE39133.1 N-methylglutamate synthase subunit A [Acidocella aminolytica 101 = DSM 11237]
MCGIAGLFLKSSALEPQLGVLMSTMLNVLTERGPDSAGFAIYGAGKPDQVKFTLRSSKAFDFLALAETFGGSAALYGDHSVVSVAESRAASFKAKLEALPEIVIVSVGKRIEMFKGIGLPDDVGRRFGLSGMAGTHAIGHTRMATESAVTVDGAHPFSTGADQCLVHNGSLSNHNDVRRTLIREGIKFATQNDTEVAAGYLSHKLREGAKLDEALKAALKDLDGFYNFVVGTENGFGVLRDPVSCKPAVMAETNDYVAFASEYRALAELPGIEAAHLFEPEPSRVYFWERAE